MKRYNYQGSVIQAFCFNGSMDLQDYPRDNLPPQWFVNAYFNNYFCEIQDRANDGKLILKHCEPSMNVQHCYAGDWVAIDENRPDIGVFFIPVGRFSASAKPINETTFETTFDSLTAANIARQKEWDTGTEPLSLSFKGNELAGETGELCNVLKKLERERLGIPGSRDTVEHAAEEMADVIICVDLIATHLGVDLWEAVAKKFNATSEKNGMKTRLVIPNG